MIQTWPAAVRAVSPAPATARATRRCWDPPRSSDGNSLPPGSLYFGTASKMVIWYSILSAGCHGCTMKHDDERTRTACSIGMFYRISAANYLDADAMLILPETG